MGKVESVVEFVYIQARWFLTVSEDVYTLSVAKVTRQRHDHAVKILIKVMFTSCSGLPKS